MTCSHYMGKSCGLDCCLAQAEQFDFFEINEPPLTEFCPMIQRYGEIVHDMQSKKSQERGDHWSSRRWEE